MEANFNMDKNVAPRPLVWWGWSNNLIIAGKDATGRELGLGGERDQTTGPGQQAKILRKKREKLKTKRK